MKMLRARLALIATAGLIVPASASADSYFSLDHPVGNLDVRANHVAWTIGDARGRQHLRGGFADTAHNLPVRSARTIAGVDLGTNSRGGTVLVYARCPGAGGRPCDLYLYSPGSRRDRRLASVSRRACSETHPHIDRGVLLFTRRTRRSRSRRRRCSGGVFLKHPGHRLHRVMRKAPVAYDFAGRFIAFERDVIGKPDAEEQQFDTEIRVLQIGRRRSRLLLRAEGTMSRAGRQGTFLSGPRLDGGFIYWQRSVEHPPRQDDILRRPLSGGRTTELERAGRAWVGAGGSSGDDLFSFAVNGPRLFYIFGGFEGRSGFPIGRVDPSPVFH